MTNPCVHYWKLDDPVTMTSKGRCVKCGATAEFPNYMPMSISRFNYQGGEKIPAARVQRSRSERRMTRVDLGEC